MIDEIRKFIKKHKTEIIVVAAGIVVVSGTIIIAKNWSAITDNFSGAIKPDTKINYGIIKGIEQPAPSLIKNQPRAIPEINKALITQTIIQKAPLEITPTEKIIGVSSHLRNLPSGYHASPMKVSTAMNNGFILNQGQTWVDAYSKAMA